MKKRTISHALSDDELNAIQTRYTALLGLIDPKAGLQGVTAEMTKRKSTKGYTTAKMLASILKVNQQVVNRILETSELPAKRMRGKLYYSLEDVARVLWNLDFLAWYLYRGGRKINPAAKQEAHD